MLSRQSEGGKYYLLLQNDKCDNICWEMLHNMSASHCIKAKQLNGRLSIKLTVQTKCKLLRDSFGEPFFWCCSYKTDDMKPHKICRLDNQYVKLKGKKGKWKICHYALLASSILIVGKKNKYELKNKGNPNYYYVFRTFSLNFKELC